jgi:hypothetical protein
MTDFQIEFCKSFLRFALLLLALDRLPINEFRIECCKTQLLIALLLIALDFAIRHGCGAAFWLKFCVDLPVNGRPVSSF